MKKFASLMYHSLGDFPGNEYNIEINDFKDQMKYLRDEGYVVEGFRELAERNISKVFPDRYILVTFDDGYKSFLNAAEILNDLGFKATFFLTEKWCYEKHNFLNNEEILALSEMHEVGSHTVSHPQLTKISLESLYSELYESKNWLEHIINKEVTSLSVPGGFINRSVVKVAKEVGYSLIGNSKEWWNTQSSAESLTLINRVAVRRSFPMEKYQNIVKLNTKYYLQRLIRSHFLHLPKSILSTQKYDIVRNMLSKHKKLR